MLEKFQIKFSHGGAEYEAAGEAEFSETQEQCSSEMGNQWVHETWSKRTLEEFWVDKIILMDDKGFPEVNKPFDEFFSSIEEQLNYENK